jgi:hypothetical protein
LTLTYEPKFCASCGSSIGRVVPLLEYALVVALGVAVAAAVVFR